MGGHTKVAIPTAHDERSTFPAGLISEEQTTLQGADGYIQDFTVQLRFTHCAQQAQRSCLLCSLLYEITGIQAAVGAAMEKTPFVEMVISFQSQRP